MTTGRLSIILHAHASLTPFDANGAEPTQLLELCEWGLLPLIELCSAENEATEPPASDDAGPAITLAVSPSLLAMLADPTLPQRLDAHLSARLEMAEAEVARLRTANRPGFAALAAEQVSRCADRLASYRRIDEGNLIDALDRLRREHRIELIPSAGAHAVLPLVASSKLRALHIMGACADFREHFGVRPTGFWLPECAWAAGIDETLLARGVKWTIAAANAVRPAVAAPDDDALPPVVTQRGLCVFPEASWLRQALVGPAGAQVDPAFSRPPSAVVPIPLHRHGENGPDPWVPAEASARAADLGRSLAESLLSAARHAASAAPLPIVLALELSDVGPRWPDGLPVLDHLARSARSSGLGVGPPLAVAADEAPRGEPISASWRPDGYFAAWVDEPAAWIYRRLGRLSDRLLPLAAQTTRPTRAWRRAWAQALRELLCAQSSDWPAAVVSATAVDEAVRRFEAHAETVERLTDMLMKHRIDESYVAEREARWAFFDEMEVLVS